MKRCRLRKRLSLHSENHQFQCPRMSAFAVNDHFSEVQMLWFSVIRESDDDLVRMCH